MPLYNPPRPTAAANARRAVVASNRLGIALGLHAGGRSVAYIARRLELDRRTVQRYLRHDATDRPSRDRPA